MTDEMARPEVGVAAARDDDRRVRNRPDGPALVEVFARVDPWGLVESGAPRDEDAGEVRDLLDHPHPAAHGVLAVFRRWGSPIGTTPAPAGFGTSPGVGREDAHRRADDIARVRAARRAPDAS